ncbi:hypothetical protein AXF42_Ash011551 [Apostasia shenzhenica]|uniref:Uncharacterized protein n=1 Tax=Apostasia shenzhenica TaxID=1088818 RepID=A0A2I0BB08_9ASPA|nr:hypothetical protein AXF42_Ash011551 [Apostasia shenzhenica]
MEIESNMKLNPRQMEHKLKGTENRREPQSWETCSTSAFPELRSKAKLNRKPRKPAAPLRSRSESTPPAQIHSKQQKE